MNHIINNSFKNKPFYELEIKNSAYNNIQFMNYAAASLIL